VVWATPPTATTGNIITAANGNVWRDDLNYLKGQIDGTGSGDNTMPSGLILNNDSVNKLTKNGANPIWFVDTLDSLQYDRATNAWWFAVGGTVITTMASTGKLTGGAFYDSGVVSVANGGNLNATHGLGDLPRFVAGWFHASANPPTFPLAMDGLTAHTIGISTVTTTQITAFNTSGGTKNMRVVAML
jgi:hypothetical protein